MTTPTIGSYTDIKGWFFPADRALFETLLSAQKQPGTLVELGAYLGRSAVIVGNHVRDDERFVVIDLFGSEVGLGSAREHQVNRSENRFSYSTLTRTQFEANYLALHPSLPEVVQGPSSTLLDHVAPGTARFVHIDASHHFAQVVEDITNTRTALQPDGIVVFDDFSNPNCPGVAAAVWAAVATGGLVPFASTPHKLFATWGDPSLHLDALRTFFDADEHFGAAEFDLAGARVLRVRATPAPTPPKAPAAPKPRRLDADELDAIAAGVARRLNPPLKRSDWVPPVLARAVRRRRAAG